MKSVTVVILRRLVSVIASQCLNDKSHIQKFCGKLICNNEVGGLYSKLFLKIGVSLMTDYTVIRQLTALFVNDI